MKTIFLDMDGVLADLHGCIQERWPEADFKERGKVFGKYLPKYVELNGFAEQRVLTHAYELVEFLLDEKEDRRTFQLAILTSSGHFYNPTSEVVHQKKVFLEKNFPQLYYIPFCVTTSGVDKSLLAHENALLIDDHEKNITRFVEAGGHGLLYNHEDSLDVVFAQIRDFLKE